MYKTMGFVRTRFYLYLCGSTKLGCLRGGKREYEQPWQQDQDTQVTRNLQDSSMDTKAVMSDLSLVLWTTALAPLVPTLSAWTSPQMPWGTQIGAPLDSIFPDALPQLELSREKVSLRIFSMLFQRRTRAIWCPNSKR